MSLFSLVRLVAFKVPGGPGASEAFRPPQLFLSNLSRTQSMLACQTPCGSEV
jgi:hypothetical protein